MLTSKRSPAGTSPMRLHEGSGGCLRLGANSLYDRLTMKSLLHLLYLAEIAPGNFRGHYSVVRRQKAWFLPAAHTGAPAALMPAISADIELVVIAQTGVTVRKSLRAYRPTIW